jgi:hypothetical protein
MPVESAMCLAVCSALKAALLLTGNAASAECAVLEAISSLNPQNVTAEALLDRTIELSIRSVASGAGSGLQVDWPDLPIELRNVLEMKPALRNCFVLRVLLGLPEAMCAALLRLHRAHVAARACAAMNWLGNTKRRIPNRRAGSNPFRSRASKRCPWSKPNN